MHQMRRHDLGSPSTTIQQSAAEPFRRFHWAPTGSTGSSSLANQGPVRHDDRFSRRARHTDRVRPDRMRSVASKPLYMRCRATRFVLLQVIPEGEGPVKTNGCVVCSSCEHPCPGWARRSRRRGQGSGGARPRRGRRALTATPFGACCSGQGDRQGLCCFRVCSGGGALSSSGPVSRRRAGE